MNKKLIIVIGLMLATSYQGLVVLDASAAPGDFQTMWVIELPRSTYFIGESVTFTVVAFASTDPTLMLPDQMANIVIRNASMVEVYGGWVTTNSNGSAPVTWESGLDAEAGNYTIILDDLTGDKVTAEFMLLYNEETFWQVKVDLIEKELQSQYNYINYLFSYNKYLENRVKWIDKQFKLLWAMSFITIMCGIYVAMHEAAMTKRSGSGLMAFPNKAFELLFRRKPIVELDSEVLEDVRIPREKRVPIYGHDKFCPICDPDMKKPMTEGMLRDHLWAVHDRLHLKTDSIMAKWRARKAKNMVKAEKKSKEPIKPAFASIEKYREEWNEETAKKAFIARLDNIKKLRKKGKLSDEEYLKMKTALRTDVDAFNRKKTEMKTQPKTEVLKQTPSPKPEVQRKVREEKARLAIPKAPEKSPAEIPISKSAIDELFEKLNNER